MNRAKSDRGFIAGSVNHAERGGCCGAGGSEYGSTVVARVAAAVTVLVGTTTVRYLRIRGATG